MLQLGTYHNLQVVRRAPQGLYLSTDDPAEESVLLPQRYVTPSMQIGDTLRVLIYLDQDERIVATTEQAIATVGQFAYLKCNWTNQYGAFLDWGIQMKDLFCPFREQKQRMEKGRTYYVYIKEDPLTHRLMATAKVERYQSPTDSRQRILDFAEQLLRYLHEHDGVCTLTDNSTAEEIADTFGVSKKAFKRAVGDLYRRRIIDIQPTRLVLR